MKKPLLLLHGAIGSAKQFEPLIPLLAGEFDVHALNLPGHGGMEIPAEPFSIELFADFVLSYLEEKEILKADLFGYSMGGYVALYLAAHYPERVNKVFTLATKLDWSPEFAAKETAMLNPEKITEKVPAFAKALEEAHAPQDWKAVLKKTEEMLLSLGRQPALSEKDFSSIEASVLVGLGELDKMVTVEECQNAVKYLPNGQFLMLPATPHPFEKMNHRLLAECIIQFMDS